MEVRNTVNALNPVSSVTSVGGPTGTDAGQAAAEDAIVTDRATVSAAGKGMALADADVRTEKVSAVRKSLDAGTYDVPASVVATSVVNSMLDGKS